jgi:hypothetical protein
MIEKLTDYLIARRNKNLHKKITNEMTAQDADFIRVLNTLRENKFAIKRIKDDGVYIRCAGNVEDDQLLNSDWIKIKSFLK